MAPGEQGPFHGFTEFFDSAGFPKPQDKPEMGVAWNAKEIDGKLYVPIEQVHELLASNGVLPKMCAALKRHMGGG